MPWDIIALPALLSLAYGFWKGLNASKQVRTVPVPARRPRNSKP
jgi:hypothetical protein